MRKILFLLTMLVIGPVVVEAQSTIGVQLGASFRPEGTPRTFADLSFFVGGDRIRNFTTYSIRPVTSQEIVYSVRTGVEADVVTAGRATLSILGQGGLATSTTENADGTYSGIFSGSATLRINMWKELSLVINGEGQNAPVNGGTWDPRGSIALRWNFMGE